MIRISGFGLAIATLSGLASCAPGQNSATQPTMASATPSPGLSAPAPVNALAAGATALSPASAGIDIAGLGRADYIRALAAFRVSCPALLKRDDTSGLTQPGDWQAACRDAAVETDDGAQAFFSSQFALVRVGDGNAFATGYFEPEIAGSRTRRAGSDVPVLRVPDDLVEASLGSFSEELKGKTVRGRVIDGKLVPYFDRAAIEAGALDGRGLEIAWAADAVDLFFLQIQGSGRLRMRDGSVMRIGYAGQNGRGYVAIGKLLRERGVFAPGQATMQGIVEYLRADSVRGAALMRENPSYIFFRELTGPGPLGALDLPVTPRASVAADPKFVPLGAPVLLAMEASEASGLWIAQDTGGAIKGANRFDTFWGAGDDAKRIAGGLATKGHAIVLIPKASAARLPPRP